MSQLVHVEASYTLVMQGNKDFHESESNLGEARIETGREFVKPHICSESHVSTGPLGSLDRPDKLFVKGHGRVVHIVVAPRVLPGDPGVYLGFKRFKQSSWICLKRLRKPCGVEEGSRQLLSNTQELQKVLNTPGF